MNINIQYVKIPVSDTLSQYVIAKLEKLASKYDWLIAATVFFKQENDSTANRDICEIELSAPGPRIFAASKEKNFEVAVKKVISELEKQLKKRKASFSTH